MVMAGWGGTVWALGCVAVVWLVLGKVWLVFGRGVWGAWLGGMGLWKLELVVLVLVRVLVKLVWLVRLVWLVVLVPVKVLVKLV